MNLNPQPRYPLASPPAHVSQGRFSITTARQLRPASLRSSVAGFMPMKASNPAASLWSSASAPVTSEAQWHYYLPQIDCTGAMRFFGLQFLGVLMEDAVFAALLSRGMLQSDWRRGHMTDGRKAYGMDLQWWWWTKGGTNSAGLTRALGYVWVVFFWLTLTLPPYVDGIRQSGAIDTNLAPVSIWKYLGRS